MNADPHHSSFSLLVAASYSTYDENGDTPDGSASHQDLHHQSHHQPIYHSVLPQPSFQSTPAYSMKEAEVEYDHPSASGQGYPKRKQVKNACMNCQKACKKCDNARPCERCVKYGFEDTCVDSVRKERKKGIKRGPYRRKDSDSTTQSNSSAHAIQTPNPPVIIPEEYSLNATSPPRTIRFESNGQIHEYVKVDAAPRPAPFHQQGIQSSGTAPVLHFSAQELASSRQPHSPQQTSAAVVSHLSSPVSSSSPPPSRDWSKLHILSHLCSAVLEQPDELASIGPNSISIPAPLAPAPSAPLAPPPVPAAAVAATAGSARKKRSRTAIAEKATSKVAKKAANSSPIPRRDSDASARGSPFSPTSFSPSSSPASSTSPPLSVAPAAAPPHAALSNGAAPQLVLPVASAFSQSDDLATVKREEHVRTQRVSSQDSLEVGSTSGESDVTENAQSGGEDGGFARSRERQLQTPISTPARKDEGIAT
ncbi:hypothetical protein DFJ73DRAFT_60480 [Zopfochytrium polystomum]|nr:hypothetical protein DFJ73DRAFT_60480 [Zopfochytrium polystomum]